MGENNSSVFLFRRIYDLSSLSRLNISCLYSWHTGSLIVLLVLQKIKYMKKMFFLMVFTAGSIIMFAQNNRYDRNVPVTVQRSWQRDYPNYSNTTWDRR